MRFATYKEAAAYARAQVRALGFAHGVEHVTDYTREGEWNVMMLPAPKNRSGWELRVEAIEVGS